MEICCQELLGRQFVEERFPRRITSTSDFVKRRARRMPWAHNGEVVGRAADDSRVEAASRPS